MPCWYWEPDQVLNTPSFRDGIDADTEAKYRSDGAKFIQKCGQDLGLTHNSIATGIVFFHRFYMFHSFKKYYKFLAAATALFLAGKVEETPKMCRDLVRSVQKHMDDRSFVQQFGNNNSRAPIEEIMQLERLMLRTLKFDFLVEHPYKHLLEMGKRLRGQQEEINTIVQHAWAFINDSLYTNLCLQWEPEIIACSVLYLGSLCSSCQIRDWDTRKSPQDKWWEHFVPGLDFPLIEHICHRILDLYQSSSGPAKAAGVDVKRQAKQAADSSAQQQKQIANSLQQQIQHQTQNHQMPQQQQQQQQQPSLQQSLQQQQQVIQPVLQQQHQQQQQHLQSKSISAAAVAAHAAMNQVHMQMSQAMPLLTANWPGYTGSLPTPPPPPPPPLPLMQSHRQHLPAVVTTMQAPPPPPPAPLIGCIDTQPQPIGVFQPAAQPVIGQQHRQQQPPIGQIGGQYQRQQQSSRTQQHPNKNLHALT